jgi:hypothetical protein
VPYLFEEITGEGRIRFENQECITCCDCLELMKNGGFEKVTTSNESIRKKL